MPAPLQIFKTGTHTDVHGQRLTFAAADLQASASAYDPALLAAPLVVGHPKLTDPAYGWVKSIFTDGAVLNAEPERVEPQFAEMVNAGQFPRMSASFYHPDSPSNPVPGVWYLRHVGFLGAAAPAVKGLRPASFAGDVGLTVEFAAPGADPNLLARLFRNLREHLLSTSDADTADRVIPDWMIEEITPPAPVPEPATDPAFSEEETMDPKKTADFAARETALSEREHALKAREDAIAQQEVQAHKSQLAEFAEGLVKSGKLLPRDKDNLVEFMAGLDNAATVSFAEAGQVTQKTPIDWFKGWLDNLPRQVEFSEVSASEDDDSDAASFAAPSGFGVNKDRLELHNKALAYQGKHNCDYDTAIDAVSR